MSRGATYISKTKPCRKCGSLERYKSTDQCVPCAKANADRQRARRKAAKAEAIANYGGTTA